ncbi:hypothetical protein D8911_03950 [Levilactobacillus brevis]|nr:hypothetical protein D8911_03950 [Levilactobacillus brevis]
MFKKYLWHSKSRSKSGSSHQWPKISRLLTIIILATVVESLWTIKPNTPLTLLIIVKALGPLIIHVGYKIYRHYPTNITGPGSAHFLGSLLCILFLTGVLSLTGAVALIGHSALLATVLFKLSVIALVTMYATPFTLLIRDITAGTK